MSADWTDQQLEAALAAIRPDVAYPPTPPLAARVQRQLASHPVAHPSRWPGPRRVWYAVAALLVVASLTGLIFPQTREAVAERLGLRSVHITHVLELEPSARAGDPRPLLGRLLDLDTARAQVGFQVLVPTADGLDTPDEVYVGRMGSDGEVALVYGPRSSLPEAPGTSLGMLISQTPGQSVGPAYGKGAGPGTQVRSVSVAGQQGFWIDGAPHQLAYLSARGDGRVVQTRLAANVLVWEQSGLTIRIEGAMALDTALRIATSMR